MTDQEREDMILSNLKLVHYAAKGVYRDPRAFYSYEDLVQEGTIGLMQAVDRYNPDYGAAFSTYAVPVIRGYILRFVRENSHSMKYSRADIDAYAKIMKIEKSIHELSKAELEELGINEKNLSAVISMLNSISIDDYMESSKDGSTTSLHDLIADNEYSIESYEFYKSEVDKIKNKVLEYFPLERDKDMLDEFYYSRLMYIPPSQPYLAMKYKISQGHVSRKIHQFMYLLKEALADAGYPVERYNVKIK